MPKLSTVSLVSKMKVFMCCVLALATLAGAKVVPGEYIAADFIENVRGTENSNTRIVSGWQASPGQFPFQLSLRLTSADGLLYGCGASIISRDWAVTAAHCTALNIVVVVVRAGATDINRPEYLAETRVWYNHPSYLDHIDQVQPNDISLLQLGRSLTYSYLIRPIRIQRRNDAHRSYANEKLIASGYGRTWTNGASSDLLNWVYLTGIANENCFATFGSIITANTICARFYNITSQSICQGDSGGPLIHIGADEESTLIGVSSFTAGLPHGCHSGIPSGFIRPGPFLNWFQTITGIDFENLDEEGSTTEPPTTTEAADTTSEVPSTTTEAPTPPTETLTTTEAPTTITEAPTTWLPTTTELPVTIPEPTEPPTDSEEGNSEENTESEEENVSEEDSSSSESDEDKELSKLLKRLKVEVKVKVQMDKELKHKHKHVIEKKNN